MSTEERDDQVIRRLTIRLPEQLLGELRVLAKKHKRSLNSETVWGLLQYVETEHRKGGRA